MRNEEILLMIWTYGGGTHGFCSPRSKLSLLLFRHLSNKWCVVIIMLVVINSLVRNIVAKHNYKYRWVWRTGSWTNKCEGSNPYAVWIETTNLAISPNIGLKLVILVSAKLEIISVGIPPLITYELSWTCVSRKGYLKAFLGDSSKQHRSSLHLLLQWLIKDYQSVCRRC